MNFRGKTSKLNYIIYVCICLFALSVGIYLYGLTLNILYVLTIPSYICYSSLSKGNILKIIRWYHIAYLILLIAVVSSYLIILAHLVPEIRVRWAEILFTVWFLISIHIILKILDYGANALFSKIFHIKSDAKKSGSIILIKNFLRIACVLLIAVPYLLSVFSINWVKFSDNTNPGRYGMNFQEVRFKTSDGIKLEGWFIESMGSSSESTVIIAPGYRTTKSCFLSYALILTGNGHNVLLFDQRGQGASSGHMHSFGQLEANDIKEAVNFIKATYPGKSKNILALGLSQGSAGIITAAAKDKRIHGVIIDSLVAEQNLFTNKVTNWLRWPLNKYITTTTNIFTSAFLSCNSLQKTNIYNDIAEISPRPLLIFHGSSDVTSDYEQAKKLYANAGKPKKLCVIPGAGHNQVLLYMRDQYMQEITNVYIESILVK